ncbi:MAG: hypothetical protein ACI9EW_003822, partial [Cellvibrionaceae bacterium]
MRDDMIHIEPVSQTSRRQINQFIRFPFGLYKGNRNWTPMLNLDMREYFKRDSFPFYDHSDAAFFLAFRNNQVVGRIAAIDHSLFNKHHQTRKGSFFFFDCEDDQEAANALFSAAGAWLKARGLNEIIGPKGFGLLDPYGLLIDGFAENQTMAFTTYNFPYYRQFIEEAGFEKEIDFQSYQILTESFNFPSWIINLAEKVMVEASLTVGTFQTLRGMEKPIYQLVQLYIDSFKNNWEYYPLPGNEIDFLIKALIPIGVPNLIKVIYHHEQPVGLLLGLPDLSTTLQQSNGRLTPATIFRALKQKSQLDNAVMVGIAITETFQNKGGSALLMTEMAKTVLQLGIKKLELINVAESAKRMRDDLQALDAR